LGSKSFLVTTILHNSNEHTIKPMVVTLRHAGIGHKEQQRFDYNEKK